MNFINRTYFSYLLYLLLDTQQMLFTSGGFQMLKLNPNNVVIVLTMEENKKQKKKNKQTKHLYHAAI